MRKIPINGPSPHRLADTDGDLKAPHTPIDITKCEVAKTTRERHFFIASLCVRSLLTDKLVDTCAEKSKIYHPEGVV